MTLDFQRRIDRRFNKYGRLVILLPALSLSVRTAPAAETDFPLIPPDAAGVVTFRNLQAFNEKLSAFGQRLSPGAKGLDLAEFEALFGLAPGTIDLSRPVHVVLSQPGDLLTLFGRNGVDDGDGSFPIVAFTPKDPGLFPPPPSGRENAERSMRGSYGRCWVLVRDDFAFVSERRRPLRRLRRTEGAGLSALIDKHSERLCDRSDVFLFLPMERWRQKISPFLLVGTNIMKMKIDAEQTAEERERRQPFIDWFLGGLTDVMQQLESFSLGLNFDGTTFRIEHGLAFNPSGSAARYLRQVKKTELPLGRSLPNRPFYAISFIQWKCPAEQSLSKRMCDVFLAADPQGGSADLNRRRELVDSIMYCADELEGMEFMFTSPAGKLVPAQVIGSDLVGDAHEALKQYRFVQENAGELMASMVCGGTNCFGKFKEVARGPKSYLELNLKHLDIPEESRRQMVAFYGKKVRYQQGAADEHHIAYALSEPPGGVAEIFETLQSGKNVTMNENVRRIRSRLQTGAHVELIVDIGRVTRFVPYLIQGGYPLTDDKVPATSLNEEKTGTGPLLGWSCSVAGDLVSCRLAIDADDVVRLVQEVGRVPGAHP